MRHARITSSQAVQKSKNDDKELFELHQYYEELLQRQEIMWCQKSRINWLKYGDCNTSFLHATTICRHRRNNIDSLKLHTGRWYSNLNEIKCDILDFNQNLYTSSKPTSTNICSAVQPRITPIMVASFMQPVTRAEVKKFVFQLGASRHLGLTKCPKKIYHHCRDIVGNDLVDVVLSFLDNGN